MVQIEGVFWIHDGVVAPLYHAGTAALSHQPLGGYGDVEVLVRPPGVKRRQQSSASAAQDQDVGL